MLSLEQYFRSKSTFFVLYAVELSAAEAPRFSYFAVMALCHYLFTYLLTYLAARLIARLPRYSHISYYIKEHLHWLPISTRIEYKVLLIVLKAQGLWV